VVVAPVALNDPRFRQRPSTFAADRRDCIDQWLELGDVVAIGACQDDRERDALRFGDEVVL
jgi:hypothetical protein